MKNKNGDDPRETFTRYHDHDDFPKSEYQNRDTTLLMSSAKDPVDIIWSNMGHSRGIVS